MTHRLTLPQSYRDVGFQRRIAELERAEQLGGRGEGTVWQMLLEAPWVKDTLFDPQRETHCPHGHVSDSHEVAYPPVEHEGRACMLRHCGSCNSTWLEPVPLP